MKRILFASAALVALTGAALAQQSPIFQGDYSSNVIQTYDRDADSNGAMLGGQMDRGDFSASARSLFQSDSDAPSGGLTWDLADQADARGL